MSNQPSEVPAPPTKTRFVLAGWLCGLGGVLYLDRICMSQAIVPIQKELGLSDTQLSFVMMAFTLAYGLFEIPTGRLGDRVGSRAILVRIVLWWSVFTALTGACTGLVTLILVRFLFGAGEAGAYPNAARVISRWFPLRERGRVQGAMLTAAQLGGALSPAVAAISIDEVGWRWSFAVFGLLGVVWAVGFWFWFRDDPAEHPGVNAAELATIHDSISAPPLNPDPVPWGAVLRNRGILVLGGVQMLGAFFTYFFYSWFPKFLQEGRAVPNREAGSLASFVIGGSVVGVLLGGFVADAITARSSDPVRVRRLFAVGCYLIAAACLFVGVGCAEPIYLACLFSVAMCAMHLTLPNWWSCAIPQGGRHVGALFGLMNGLGVAGALVSQGFVGVFADWQKWRGFAGREKWDPIIYVYVGGLLLAAVVWWLYRLTPLEDGPVTPQKGSQ